MIWQSCWKFLQRHVGHQGALYQSSAALLIRLLCIICYAGVSSSAQTYFLPCDLCVLCALSDLDDLCYLGSPFCLL